ncbi:MAG: CHAT domain-containing protein [Acidobacteria bacterium]|nr:MAG: CHAT domain-containing protein [Acidobacteriota bacterium]
MLDAEHPRLSRLLLSQVDRQGRPRAGDLYLHDVYELSLAAELVVLSGCRTALGREVRGEGLIGLSRGFFYAGVPRLVASLWQVEDRTTAELMERFYRALLADGLAPPAALRRAQLELRRQPAWRDPFHWAAFVAQGEWR